MLGPVQPVALGGYHFGVTFTGETSRYRYFFPLKTKDEVLGVFQQLVAELTALGFTVRQLRSDNGGEYISKEFKAYCSLHNIFQQFTPPNTPRSNSISERFNRVLVERARTALDSAHLPKFLWAAAMSAVTYLYNRTISTMHVSKTPFELLFGAKPNVRNLRAYGCSAFMYNFAAQGKLDRRAFKGALVGYDHLSSSYLIYIPRDKVDTSI